jgi:hypothetical protein
LSAELLLVQVVQACISGEITFPIYIIATRV